MKRSDKNLIVGLDIGTSKVSAIVGEITDGNGIEVIGMGIHPSRGLKKGVVVNIESTVQSIRRAVEEAELMAGVPDPFGVHRNRGQPHPQPQLPRRRADPRQGSDAG